MGREQLPVSPTTARDRLFYASGHPEDGGNLGVIISRDDGRNWEQLSKGRHGPVDFHTINVSPADPRVMYGLYGDIQVSRDGGRTCTALMS